MGIAGANAALHEPIVIADTVGPCFDDYSEANVAL